MYPQCQLPCACALPGLPGQVGSRMEAAEGLGTSGWDPQGRPLEWLADLGFLQGGGGPTFLQTLGLASTPPPFTALSPLPPSLSPSLFIIPLPALASTCPSHSAKPCWVLAHSRCVADRG